MTLMAISSKEDILRAHNWLGHLPDYTELVAVPPKDHKEANAIVWHTKNPDMVLDFVNRHHKDHTLLYGKNPRPRIFKKENSHARSALEREIEIAKNIATDFDFLNKKRTKTRITAVKKFVKLADEYYGDLGLQAPERAYTGQGFHLLFAHPPIVVAECPDLADRVAKFISDFEADFHKEIAQYELKLDNIFRLQGPLRIYGTAKPDVGIVSEFYGAERKEDQALSDLLLSMDMNNGQHVPEPVYGPSLINIYDLPPIVKTLISNDPKLQSYWDGVDKPNGHDTSPSGYDYSMTRRLIILGERNIDTLGSAIAHRPGSSVHTKPQPDDYIRRTIAAALTSKQYKE